MDSVPRSRALVRLDGPGHIMPIEPVTPPDSTVWRIVHVPVILAVLAVALLAVAALAISPVGQGIRTVASLPGARYLVPLIGAAAVIAGYLLFVRAIERRPDAEELDRDGWWQETALGALGGVALPVAVLGLIALAGAVRIAGTNPPGAMALPIVVQLATAVILELIVCGLGFRLIERWLGSWASLLGVLLLFALFRALAADATPATVAAVALQAGILFAAVFMATRRLWAAIGLHAGWKIAQIALFAAATTDGGLLVTELDGPDWLTGGGAGVDASLPALLIDALAIVVLLTVAIRRGRIVRPVWQRGRTANVRPSHGLG